MLMAMACAMYRHTIGAIHKQRRFKGEGRGTTKDDLIHKPHLLTRQERGEVRGGADCEMTSNMDDPISCC